MSAMAPSRMKGLPAAIAVAAALAGCQSNIELDPCNREDNPLGSCVMDFSEVLVGRSKRNSLTVRNRGQDPEVIDPLKLSGEQFILSPEDDPPEQTLDPGEEDSFAVTFRPRETGKTDGQVHFQRQPAPPETTLQVKGEGIGFRSEGKLVVRLDRDGDPDTTNDRRVVEDMIDFGERVVSTTRDEDHSRLIFIENDAFATMRVTLQVPTSGSGFDTVEMPRFDRPIVLGGFKLDRIRLRAGEVARLKVYFVPPEAKVYAIFIEAYKWSDPNTHHVQFGLVGEGKAPTEDTDGATDHQDGNGEEQPDNQ